LPAVCHGDPPRADPVWLRAPSCDSPQNENPAVGGLSQLRRDTADPKGRSAALILPRATEQSQQNTIPILPGMETKNGSLSNPDELIKPFH